MLNPELPGVFRNVLVNTLSQFARPGNAVEPRQLLAEFDAHYHPRAGLDRLALCRSGIARFIRHSNHLVSFANPQHTATSSKCLAESTVRREQNFPGPHSNHS